MLVSFSSQGPLSHHWHAVARSEDVGRDQPVSVELLRDEIVLWRGPSGRVIAAPDRCTHRKAELSLGEIKDGCLECPLHGWTFGEDGRCIRIPKREVIVEANHLQTIACEEQHGLVWICQQALQGEIPKVPDVDPGFRRANGSPMRWDASAPYIVEALLEQGARAGSAQDVDVPFTYRRTVSGIDGSTALLMVTCSPVGAATSVVFPVLWTHTSETERHALLEAQVTAMVALQPEAERIVEMFGIDENAAADGAAGGSGWRRALLEAMSASR